MSHERQYFLLVMTVAPEALFLLFEQEETLKYLAHNLRLGEPEIKVATSIGSLKNREIPEK